MKIQAFQFHIYAPQLAIQLPMPTYFSSYPCPFGHTAFWHPHNSLSTIVVFLLLLTRHTLPKQLLAFAGLHEASLQLCEAWHSVMKASPGYGEVLRRGGEFAWPGVPHQQQEEEDKGGQRETEGACYIKNIICSFLASLQ